MLPVVILYLFYSFFKLIKALSDQSSWKNRAALCICVVANVTSVEENYKRRKGAVRTLYSMNVQYQGQWLMGMYEEILEPNHTSDLFPGKNVSYLFDPTTGMCKDPAALKAEVKNHLLILLACIGILAVFMAVAPLIG